jgi:GNAT superfamily N-acetyltransferase
MTHCEITPATTREDIAAVRALFIEYQEYLDIDLDFQNFGEELAVLPGKYAPPHGRLFLARYDGKVAGCAAFYPMDEAGDVCELKRLYVRRDSANLGIGTALFERAMQEAQAIGYTTMRLDSLRRLKKAGRLYKHYGFYEIAPYNDNPHADVYYLERKL